MDKGKLMKTRDYLRLPEIVKYGLKVKKNYEEDIRYILIRDFAQDLCLITLNKDGSISHYDILKPPIKTFYYLLKIVMYDKNGQAIQTDLRRGLIVLKGGKINGWNEV